MQKYKNIKHKMNVFSWGSYRDKDTISLQKEILFRMGIWLRGGQRNFSSLYNVSDFFEIMSEK